jgi:hypothetical protein
MLTLDSVLLTAALLTLPKVANSLEGYWSSTVYNGVTCGYLAGNEEFIQSQSGYRFGVCEVGYDAYGVAVSSAMYTLDCNTVSSGSFQGTYTLYADLECLSKPISTSTWTKSATCSTSGSYTTSYSCVSGTSKPPYKSLSKGHIVGFVLSSSSLSLALMTSFSPSSSASLQILKIAKRTHLTLGHGLVIRLVSSLAQPLAMLPTNTPAVAPPPPPETIILTRLAPLPLRLKPPLLTNVFNSILLVPHRPTLPSRISSTGSVSRSLDLPRPRPRALMTTR